eukprot:1898925-Alexandrium_andersonii.AAC.1
MEQQIAQLEQALQELRQQAEQEHRNVMARLQSLDEQMGRQQGWQASVADTIVRMQQATGARIPGQQEGAQAQRTWNRDISESKAVQGLSVFHGGDKGYYKEWHA